MKVFQREKCDITEFGKPYRVRAACKKQCEVKLNGQIIEEINVS